MSAAATTEQAVRTPDREDPPRDRSGPPEPRFSERGLVVAILVPVALLAIAGWTHRWVADDAFINFRVLEQVLAGNGPVFNAGERVEVGTSPLWLLLLLVVDAVVPLGLEWTSVVLGLSLAVAGVVLACVAAAESVDRARRVPFLPLGALVFVSVPPVWDFATSGLETGLGFAWIGLSSLALVRLHRRARTSRRTFWTAVLLGLGPLIRPDFAVISAVLLPVAVIVVGRPVLWRGARFLAVAMALPVAFEVFRMGYYAAVLPNTAIAKEGSASYTSQGLIYLADLVTPYWLWVPLALLLVFLRRRLDLRLLVAASPAIAGLLHGAFVVRAGGDFMHGRMLLPGLFALLVPVAVVAPRRRIEQVAAALVVLWCVVCAATLRTSYWGTNTFTDTGAIAHERGFYTVAADESHPVTLGDYEAFTWPAQGRALRARAERGEAVLSFEASNPEGPGVPPTSPARRRGSTGVFVGAAQVGLTGYAAGPRVWVVDRLGLGDPVGSRLQLVARGRPGHEKLLPFPWLFARFGDGGAPSSIDPQAIAAARRALTCDAYRWDGIGSRQQASLRELLAAVSSPLTPGRFLRNLRAAPALTKLRVPGDPVLAAGEICP